MRAHRRVSIPESIVRAVRYLRKHRRSKVVVFVSALAVTFAGYAGCQSRTRLPRMNLLVIFVDTLRADHLGCYGYTRNTSPNIDRFAEGSTLFLNALSQSPWTLPSTASLFTGLYPTRHQTITRQTELPDHRRTLAEILRDHGHRTGAVVSNIFVSSKYNLDQGFDDFDESEVGGHRDISSPGVTALGIEWLREHGEAPFFLFLHYFDPHHDYLGHPEFPFGEPYEGWVDSTMRFEELKEKRHGLGPEDIAYLVSLYDSEIAFTDHHVARVLDELDRLGLAESTLVVLAADHGEGFMDHDWLGHTRGLYEELIRVPLILRNPQMANLPHVFTPQVEMIDLLPTILDMLGIEKEARGIDGSSFVRALQGRVELSSPAFSEVCFHPLAFPEDMQIRPGVNFRSVREGDWKLIHAVALDELELYDLATDPFEKNNLARSTDGKPRERLRSVLAEWTAGTEETARQENLASNLFQIDPETEERLRALGYVQ